MPDAKNLFLKFKTYIEEIQALIASEKLLAWDLEINMPKSAAEDRAWQISIMSKLIHKKLTSCEMNLYLNELRKKDILTLLDSKDKALIREAGREYDKAVKVPGEIIEALANVTAKAQLTWQDARKKQNFELFAPSLEKIIALKQKIADYIGYTGSPYNALLDDYEEGMNTEKLENLFSKIKKEIITLVQEIQKSNIKPDTSFLNLSFSKEKQIALCQEILEFIGFDLNKGHFGESTHPFTIGIGPNDVRLTTRVNENNLLCAIGSTIHEGGHALYEQGIDPALYKSYLFNGASLAIHESQSRLYETIIGQGLPFWSSIYPKLQNYFKSELNDISLDKFYKAINKVEPSLIRIEADEVTYNLHIIIRYEIEKDLIENKIKIKEVPEVWSEKYQKYLGVIPKNHAEGALQDIHWSLGAIGYFPTYTLGNLYAAQFYFQAKKDIPNLENEIEKGNLSLLRNWLKEKIHSYGMIETPEQIVKRICGQELNSDYFISYIKDKYSKLYNLKLKQETILSY